MPRLYKASNKSAHEHLPVPLQVFLLDFANYLPCLKISMNGVSFVFLKTMVIVFDFLQGTIDIPVCPFAIPLAYKPITF